MQGNYKIKNKFQRVSHRPQRLASVIQRAVADLLNEHFFLPVTISEVVLSSDLQHAKIFLVTPGEGSAVFGETLRDSLLKLMGAQEQDFVDLQTDNLLMLFLDAAKHDLRHLVAQNVAIKQMPEIKFVLDNDGYSVKSLMDLDKKPAD